VGLWPTAPLYLGLWATAPTMSPEGGGRMSSGTVLAGVCRTSVKLGNGLPPVACRHVLHRALQNFA